MEKKKTICFEVRNAWFNIARMYNSIATGHDSTVTTGYVLLNIDEENGTPSTQIAPQLGMEPSSLTRVLKSLEEKKLITRKTDKKDRRQVRICLTKKGKEKRAIAKQTVKNFNNIIQQSVPEKKLRSFLEVLQQINTISEANQVKEQQYESKKN